MKLKKLSLRVRIFIAMILLVLMASVLIAAVAIYQYNEETKDYHTQRLERKEQNIKSHLDFVVKETTYEIIPERIPLIFKEKIYEVASIHNLQVSLYDIDGTLLISSETNFESNQDEKCIETEILNTLTNTLEHRYVEKRLQDGETYRYSYSYIKDLKEKPLAIVKLPYLENDNFLSKELNEFLERLGYAYLFVLLIAISIEQLAEHESGALRPLQ